MNGSWNRTVTSYLSHRSCVEGCSGSSGSWQLAEIQSCWGTNSSTL